MSKITKIVTIAVILILIGGIGSLATLNKEQFNIHQSESIASAQVNVLQVDLNNGTLQLQGTTESNIRAVLTGKERKESSIELKTEVTDDRLIISTNKTRRTFFNIFPPIRDLHLTVYVPGNIIDDIRVEVDNGRLTIKDVKAKQLTAETNNGQVELYDSAAEQVHVTSSNGRVILENVTGKLIGDTNNGRVTILTADLDRDIAFETNNGSIQIKTDKAPTNATLDIRAQNGKATVFGNRDWDSRYGSGDHQIRLRTNNGSVTISQIEGQE